MPGNNLKDNWIAIASPLTIPQNFMGNTVVIAPHPDDESLGCGGTIALLKKAAKPVKIIFVSDGSMSHPNSKKYPVNKLIKLRQQEAIRAAEILGVPKTDCIFLLLKDSLLPGNFDPGFTSAVNLVATQLQKLQPSTILLPWKNDPHKDHRACWQMVNAALQQCGLQALLFHYLIWFWERGKLGKNDPLLKKINWRKVDISEVVKNKEAAIAAHGSQVTALVDDDADGFTLSPEVLSHFNDSFELFICLKHKI